MDPKTKNLLPNLLYLKTLAEREILFREMLAEFLKEANPTISPEDEAASTNSAQETLQQRYKSLHEAQINAYYTSYDNFLYKYDPQEKSDHEIRIQLQKYATAYANAAVKGDLTSKESLARIIEYAAYLREYKDFGKVVDDLGLVVIGQRRDGLDLQDDLTYYTGINFGATGFDPKYAREPADHQARHFIGYLLGAKAVGLCSPLFSYWREIRQGAPDTWQDIDLAAFWFYQSFTPDPYGCRINLNRSGEWIREKL